MNQSVRKLTISAMFLAVGIILPMAFHVWRACHISRVKIPRGVVIDEPKSDLQVSYREVWERGSNSEIVA